MNDMLPAVGDEEGLEQLRPNDGSAGPRRPPATAPRSTSFTLDPVGVRALRELGERSPYHLELALLTHDAIDRRARGQLIGRNISAASRTAASTSRLDVCRVPLREPARRNAATPSPECIPDKLTSGRQGIGLQGGSLHSRHLGCQVHQLRRRGHSAHPIGKGVMDPRTRHRRP
jgi:hypothetical protein